MLADWATESELGPSDTPLMKLAHEIVGSDRDDLVLEGFAAMGFEVTREAFAFRL